MTTVIEYRLQNMSVIIFDNSFTSIKNQTIQLACCLFYDACRQLYCSELL